MDRRRLIFGPSARLEKAEFWRGVLCPEHVRCDISFLSTEIRTSAFKKQLPLSVTSVNTIDEQRTPLNSILIPRGSKTTRELPSAILERSAWARLLSYGGPDWACDPFCVSRPTCWIFSDLLFPL